MPMKIRISADSTCDLTSELIEQYDVKIAPLYILMDDRALRDGIECTREDIFAYTSRTGKLCGTAAVSIADYLDFFGEELKTHDQIVHFTISSDMSACFQNACDAAEEFPGRVFVVDSRNLSTGIGHLVIDGALLAREGKSGEEIQAILDERREKLNVSFVIDTLEYLRKGGRCSTVAALGANLLKLKPCIEVHEGKMSVAKKYRGTLAKAIESYVTDRIKEGEDSSILNYAGTLSNIDMEAVGKALQGNDSLALEVVNRGAEYLGRMFHSLNQIFDINVFVYGGGVTKLGKRFIDRIVASYRHYSLMDQKYPAQFIPAELGDNAGMIAEVALDRYRAGAFSPLSTDALAHGDLEVPY